MKLAQSVQILDLQPIVGADRIEVASVLGYKVVCQRNLYKVGDLAIFIVPDTIVPRATWSEFLFKGDQSGKEKVRLKVCRLKGQVSQGLLIPLADAGKSTTEEGTDFTSDLSIEKYEKSMPECLGGDAVGYMPGFLRKTDEDNLRSNVSALAELAGREVYVTVKVDGSSGTFFMKDAVFGVCSRKLQLIDHEANTFWKISRKYDLQKKLALHGLDVAIQGEVHGPDIQGNKLGLTERGLKVFDVWNIQTAAYFGLTDLQKFCDINNLPTVDIIYRGLFNFTFEDLIKMANELKYPNGQAAEGIVIRPVETTYSEVLGRRLSVKIISEKFALKHGE